MSESEADWSIGVVAETLTGEVILRMTQAQADALREMLDWLMGDDES